MTTDTVGGVWTYSLDLARSLQACEVQIELATMGKALDASQRQAVAHLPNVTVHESTYRLEWQQDPWSDVDAAGEWLLGIEQKTRPDLVHLGGYAHGALPWKAPVLIVGHSCVYSWYESVRKSAPPEATWGRYRGAVARGLRAADRVTAPSRAMLASLRKFYGPHNAVPAIHNGSAFAVRPSGRREPFILTAGRLWDRAKNVAVLEEVAPGIPWPILAAGETRHPDAGAIHLRHVQSLGQLSPAALADWMSRASIYLLPARYEPFGLSAVEAARAGCALVLSDIPSLREVWGTAAQYVDPDDVHELISVLRNLIGSPSMRREWSNRAHWRARRLTLKRSRDRYLDVYADLLSSSA